MVAGVEHYDTDETAVLLRLLTRSRLPITNLVSMSASAIMHSLRTSDRRDIMKGSKHFNWEACGAMKHAERLCSG